MLYMSGFVRRPRRHGLWLHLQLGTAVKPEAMGQKTRFGCLVAESKTAQLAKTNWEVIKNH